jgi:hypothetical protein
MHETAWSGFDLGGHYPLSGPMEKHLSYIALTLNADPGSTQILTQNSSAQSQTVSQLKSSGTMLTIKFPQFSPSRLSKHLRMESVRILHHILTT